MKKLAATMVLGMVAMVGCAGEPAPETESTGDEGAAMITETVVSVDAEGKEVVHSRQVPADQPVGVIDAHLDGAEHLGQASQAITTDTACTGAELILYDAAAQTGNRICFVRTLPSNDGADLGAYCRTSRIVGSFPRFFLQCTSTWTAAVRSFRAGADNGTFSKVGAQPYYFNANESNNAPPASVTGATRIELGSTCKRRLCPQTPCVAGEQCFDGVCLIDPLYATCVNGISTNRGGDRNECGSFGCGSDGHCTRSCNTNADCAVNGVCDDHHLCLYAGGSGYWGSEDYIDPVAPAQPSDSVGSCSYVSCASDSACRSVEMCHNGACIPFAPHCTADMKGEVWWDRQTYDCGEFRCNPNRGGCFTSCLQTGDCAEGYSCHEGACLNPMAM